MEKERKVTTGEALAPGSILCGRYRIDSILGKGGFGITYRSQDLKRNCAVAIKELFPAACVTRAYNHRTVCVCLGRGDSFAHLLLRFEQEAQLLMQLQGVRGLIQVFHLFKENNTAYYVMELLVGEDLSYRLQNGNTMTWPQLSPVLMTLMDVLDQIHSIGLIHRDISPDNIFLTQNSGVRLIDFGSVRKYQGNDYFTAVIKQGFAPWEQYLTNGKQGPYTDVYALCATAYFALSGKSLPQAPERRMHDTLIPLEYLCPDMPKCVSTAISRGLTIEPEGRFQTIRQLRDAMFPERDSRQQELLCIRGIKADHCWKIPPGGSLRIGRGSNCDIVYPDNTAGISRVHCTLYHTPAGELMIRDEGSTCGTHLAANNRFFRISPHRWYSVEGMHICFGKQEEYMQKGS